MIGVVVSCVVDKKKSHAYYIPQMLLDVLLIYL